MPEPTAPEDPFTAFAAELSHNLPLIHRLLAEHPPSGPCYGCALPRSQGVPPAPCGVRSVALAALSIRLGRDADAAEEVTR